MNAKQRQTLPKGKMTVRKARQRWQDVRDAARSGDPDKMVEAVSKFESIADTMFANWSGVSGKWHPPSNM